jgi:outer membrane protein assembly factor BamB
LGDQELWLCARQSSFKAIRDMRIISSYCLLLTLSVFQTACGEGQPPPTVWTVKLNNQTLSSGALGHNGEAYFNALKSGKVYCVSLNSGKVVWSLDVAQSLSFGWPVVGDDATLYLVSPGQTLHAVDVSTEKERWTLTLDGQVTPRLALAARCISGSTAW